MKYYVGIDLGGTNIVAGVVNEKYEIIAKESTKTNLPRSAEEIINDMVILAKTAVENANLTMNDIVSVGVGAPGTVNGETGVIEYANNLKFENVPLKKTLEKELNKPVYVNNDANVAAFGEYKAGSAKGSKNAIAITLGTGVGGGIVLDGDIYSGSNFAGAELGHIVINLDGSYCTCGRHGCFEAYCSATALIARTIFAMVANKSSAMWDICQHDLNKVNGKTAFDGKRIGDPTATEIVDTYIKYLACGVTSIINIFQPDILCIGGGICKEGDYLLKPLKELVSKEVYSKNSKKQTEIVIAKLGNDAGIIGAALLGENK